MNAGKEAVKQAPQEIKEKAQLLVEYTLTVVLVTLVFWVAIKYTAIDKSLYNAWSSVIHCMSDPATCNP